MSFTHKVTYSAATEFVFDPALIEITGGLARLKDLGGATYSTSNPTITTQNMLQASVISTFIETKSAAGSDAVQYTIIVDGVEKYWNGTAWVQSNGTYTQSNSAATLNTNMPSLLSLGHHNVRVKAFLHSNDGTTRPTLTDNTFGFSYLTESADAISECLITCYLADLTLDLLTTALEPTLYVKNHRGFLHGNRIITPFIKTASFNSSGYAELSIIETETVGEELEFFITYKEGSSTKMVRFERAFVPNLASAPLSEISVVRPLDFG